MAGYHHVNKTGQVERIGFKLPHITVGVGGNHDVFAGFAGEAQKVSGAGPPADQVAVTGHVLHHGHLESFAPTIHAVPVQSAASALHGTVKIRLHASVVKGMVFRQVRGHELQPKMVVKMQIQQGAVHV